MDKKKVTFMVTDRNNKGEPMGIHARMSLFNQHAEDLNGNEALVLSWFLMTKFVESKSNISASYAYIADALGGTVKIVRETVKSLEDKGLLTIDKSSKTVSYHPTIKRPSREYRAMTKNFLISKTVSFKVKGFLANLLLTSNSYVLEIGTVSAVSRRLGMSRNTVVKYLNELRDRGYMLELEGKSVIDMRLIITDAIDEVAERALTAVAKVKTLEGRIKELEEIVTKFLRDGKKG